MPRTTQIDPSRTTTIRRAFAADIVRRFRAVQASIKEVVVVRDVFGLMPAKHIVVHQDLPPRAFEFKNDPGKIEAFRAWLKEMTDAKILSTDYKGDPWLAKYIESAYKKGKLRGYQQVIRSRRTKEEPVMPSIGVVFGAPETVIAVQALFTRAFNELRGVNDAMAQQLSRILSQGFAQGQNPIEIARAMTREIDVLTRQRAVLIARTETIRAHAEAQLDAYKEMSIEQVEVLAEWLTAGDDRVCPLCSAQAGAVYTVDEARGMIPMHPLCRCAWAPVAVRKAAA